MAQLASLRTHTDAILALLRTNLYVFDAGAPDLDDTPGSTGEWGWQGTPGRSKFRPYAVLYPLTGGVFDGTLGCPDDDANLIWQVTCVGSTRTQCEWAADKTLETLVGATPAVAGRGITRLYADIAGGGVRRDDSVQPPVFISTPRFRAYSSPA